MGQIRNSRFSAFAVVTLALAGAVLPALAQDQDDLKRGVARLSLMNGEVSVRRGDAGEWVAGVINAPLLSDDHVATGANSRTEVQFDSSNVLRLGANAELRLTQVEYGHYQMDLGRGVMTYRVLRNVNEVVEVDTPSLSVRPTREGSVRISVNDAGETEVTARGGDVEIFNPRGSQWLRSGQTMLARGAAGDSEFQVVNAGGPDEWDRWCDSRDRLILQSVSARNVGPGVYGTEDMDAAGTWNNVPEYGNVWHPTAVPADWAPYQSGRWVWDDWYGWTWVSYDPWGWAPYHYGRWFHHDRFGWCWYPGLMTARHYWSPALVAFVGFGGGGGIGFGFGNIGWVPLAPYEVFHPWWGRGFYGANRFNRNINITNVNITNVYRNARFNNAVSAVRVNDFQTGRFNNVARMNGTQIGRVGALQGHVPLAPGSASMRFSDRPASVAPRSTANTQFFRPQQGASGVQRGSLAQPNAARGGQPVTGQDNGWRRFGSPSNQPGSPQGNAPAATRNGFGQVQRPSAAPQQNQQAAPRNDTNRGGWQRFGSPAPGNANSPAQRQSAPAPRQNYQSSPSNDRQQPQARGNQYSGGSSRQESLRITPPVVRERPSYNAPQRQNAPSYSAPRQSAPSYSAPRQSAPAPRQSAPSAPRQSSPGNSGSRGNSGNNHNNGGHGR